MPAGAGRPDLGHNLIKRNPPDQRCNGDPPRSGRSEPAHLRFAPIMAERGTREPLAPPLPSDQEILDQLDHLLDMIADLVELYLVLVGIAPDRRIQLVDYLRAASAEITP